MTRHGFVRASAAAAKRVGFIHKSWDVAELDSQQIGIIDHG